MRLSRLILLSSLVLMLMAVVAPACAEEPIRIVVQDVQRCDGHVRKMRQVAQAVVLVGR
mgnify:CR=1 FL=1